MTIIAQKQPPSGGCVLKQAIFDQTINLFVAATFGWLCVETIGSVFIPIFLAAATFGWLCVETYSILKMFIAAVCSHLRVAVC